MKIDLHSHTHYSDGLLSPQELLLRAENMQVDVLAITDHDCVSGISEAITFSQQQARPVTVIPGIELSTKWHGFDIHILGLNVDHENAVFLQRLVLQHDYRKQRALQINQKLEKAQLFGVLEVAQTLAGVGQITRAHFARAMVNMGAVSNMEQAFRKYLGKGQRAFVTPQWISIAEAVQWITDAGGQAVLAHPAHYDMSTKWLRRLVAEFTHVGGEGIEVTHPQISPVKKQLLKELALEHRLKASSGSDFHGPGRWSELGRHLQIDDELEPIWRQWSVIGKDEIA